MTVGSEPPADAAPPDRPGGGPPAIEELIRAHYAAVYRYAHRLTGREADAEDLVQQAFLLAQQRLPQLRAPERASGWLFSIVRTCYLKALRKRTPTPAASLEMNVDELPAPGPEGYTLDPEELQAALNDLPDEFRVVLVMFYLDEMSYRDIAAELDLPIGTVMSRLSRAKGRLRGRLMKDEPAAVAPVDRAVRPAPNPRAEFPQRRL